MKRIFLSALTLFMFAALALGQGSTGRLVGTITDPGGAVIPNATITVKDNQTGRERTTTASGEGSFDVSQLEFGTYTVTVTAQGYSTFTATELKIDANREYTLNATLQAGGVQESVTVVAGADVVNASNAELSNTISPRQVKELPINGRNPLALLNLLPGVNPTSQSINGQRGSSTNYTRDGINVQDNFIRTGFVADRPTVDDTGEFTVITQNAGAQFGSGSTQVQLVTPRGGEHFHGALVAFNRNSEFGANTFFNNRNVDANGVGIQRPFLNRNQFGGTLSGPSVLPHFGEGGSSVLRKHAFFFVNYEGFRQAQQNAGAGTTLLPAARNGTFTYTDNSGVSRTINVLNGSGLNLAGTNQTTFNSAGGVLVVDPLVQSRILNNLPTAGNGATTGTNFLQAVNFNVSAPVTRNAVTGRYDVQFNDRNALNFVYKQNRELNARTDLALGFQTRPFVFQGGPTKLYVLAYNMAPTPKLSNEIRFGYQRSEPFFQESGIPSDFLISVPLVTNPEASFRSQGRNTDQYTLQDNGSYTLGNHSIRFGAQFQAFKFVALNFAGTTPTFVISSTSNPNTPGLTSGLFPGGINTTDLGRANNLRYLLGGVVGSGRLTANVLNAQSGFQLGAPSIRDLRYKNIAPYVEDQWRVSPKLTLNYGLRYDYYTPLTNPDQVSLEPRISGQTPREAVLDPNGVFQLVGGNAGHAGDFFRADKNNFAPDFSFAYTPTFKNKFLSGFLPGEGKTVLRGGFRISYNSDEYARAPDNGLINNVGVGSTTVNSVQGSGSTATANLSASLSGANAFFQPVSNNFAAPALPTLPRPFAANNTAAVASRFGIVSVIDPNLQVPRVMEYNLGFQREIGSQTAIEVRYVGSRSNQLVRTIDYNQIDIRNNGFVADFIRAQRNLAANQAINPSSTNFLTAPGTTTTNLTVLNRLTTPTATVISFLQMGLPADLAVSAIQSATTGGIPFSANPNTGEARVLGNGGIFRYNSLQAEIRRRFAKGYSYQVNYTFQKVLADSTQELQTNVDRFIDNANPRLNYARADYDRTHTINANTNIELPFGRGRRFLSDGIASKIFGGFQFTGIVNISSGAPISIRDPRGTVNTGDSSATVANRSFLQPATSSLTTSQIKKLVGVFKTPNGVFFIDPSVLQATAIVGGTRQSIDLRQPLPAGASGLQVRGASAVGSAPFAGQVFFQNAPGSTGNLPLNFINGPVFFNINSGIFRNFKFTETKRLQLRMEAFNLLNHTNFFTPSGGNANSTGESSTIFDVNGTNFGRITGSFAPRVVQFGARFDF